MPSLIGHCKEQQLIFGLFDHCEISEQLNLMAMSAMVPVEHPTTVMSTTINC